MPCNHIMLDLETLSTRKDAAIIQIAALAFDPVTGEHGPWFNAFIRDPSGHLNVQTIAWWMQQKPAARIGAAVADHNDGDTLNERAALQAFAEWLGAAPVEALWSHGATFDIVLLENAYARQTPPQPKPWSYRVERDTRTLYALAPGGMPAVAQDPERTHDAAYDCEVQVQQVVGALRALRQAEDHARSFLAHEETALDAHADTQRAPDSGGSDARIADDAARDEVLANGGGCYGAL